MGKLTLKDGTVGLLYDLTGLELSDDLIASAKRDTASWKNPNLMEMARSNRTPRWLAVLQRCWK